MLINNPIKNNDNEDRNLHSSLNEVIYKKLDKQTSELEQLCERIENLEIQQTNVSNTQQQQHYPTIPLKETTTLYTPYITSQEFSSLPSQIKLPSIGELIDYLSVIGRIQELEINLLSLHREIDILKKENLNLNEKLSNHTNNMKFIHVPIGHNDQGDGMITGDNSVPSHIPPIPPIPPPEATNDLINLQRVTFNNSNNNYCHDNSFENIHMELQSVANELSNDRNLFKEKMNSIRD